ncbi:MAG: hypothetical protein ACK481_07670 [Candidatus Melainabacteria bacterium]|jgi:hypothetical protein
MNKDLQTFADNYIPIEDFKKFNTTGMASMEESFTTQIMTLE